MKEIIAVIRPGQWQKTKARLVSLGYTSYTTARVYGRGKQRGLRLPAGKGKKAVELRYIPKRMVWIWAEDAEVDGIVEAISDVNRTGAMGDGKIFICPMRGAMRLRTGELGACAL